MAETKRDKLRQHAAATPSGITDLMARMAAGINGQAETTSISPVELQQLQDQAARALKRTDDGIEILNCKGNAAGLLIPDDIVPDDMDYLAETLFNFEGHIHLYIGDMLAKQERMAYGSTEAIAEKYHRETKTVQKWKSVCSGVSIILRRMILARYPAKKPLTMKHYEIVMAMADADQERWLTLAADGEWSTSQLSLAIATDKLSPGDVVANDDVTTVQDVESDAPALSDENEEEATDADLPLSSLEDPETWNSVGYLEGVLKRRTYHNATDEQAKIIRRRIANARQALTMLEASLPKPKRTKR